jgi:hypothetical protein
MSDNRHLLDDVFRLQTETHSILKQMCANDHNLLDTVKQLTAQLDDVRLRLSTLERAIGIADEAAN